MYTLFIFLIVLSILVVIHELGHFIAAKRNGVYVEEFGFGIPPRIFGIKIGETLYSLNLLPFGGFVKVLGEEEDQLKNVNLSDAMKKRTFAYKKHWQKALILSAGVICNFLLGWVIISYLFVKGVPAPSDNVRVEEVIKGSPAAEAGLKKNDQILSIQYQNEKIVIKNTNDVASASKKFAGRQVTVALKRGDNPINTHVIPRKNPPKNQGALGIVITNFVIKKYPVYQAPFYGLVEAARITGLIFKDLISTLARVLTFHKPEGEIAGPVGIAKLSAQAAQNGFDALLQLIGLLSLNLAVINILPFPALDGGRLAIVIYEWISKRKFNATLERRMNIVGFSLLIGLLLLVTASDILKLLK